MRLIKLKIKNIASLKGEHEIDFSQIQNQSPLFAITGETGAGKSSILNSIGLALYGKVYKSNVTQNDLVTLGEKEGQIELIFQAQGKHYLAYWRAKIRKQNGELYSTPQTPQRDLYTLEGVEFDSPKVILIQKIEELLNLDFDQFCKCIILNQGEFAKFLSSSFTERKEILEKLYPGEMLESLSRALKAELDTLQKQKNDLDIELAALKGDGPQVDDLTVLKDKLEQECKLHEGWVTVLESMNFHFTSLHSYHSKYIDTQKKMEVVKATLTAETTIFNDLLTTVQKATETFLSVQKEQEKNLPRLQELLKLEESLKHSSELKNENSKSKTKFQEQVAQTTFKLNETNKKIDHWNEEAKKLSGQFIHPLIDLKKCSTQYAHLFELYSQNELLEQEVSAKNERLIQLENQGKEEAKELKLLTSQKEHFEEDKKKLEILEKQKSDFVKRSEQKQRATIQHDELKASLKDIESEKALTDKKLILFSQNLTQHQQEQLPLQTTMKLQSLLGAIEICLTHPALEENKACPVCKTQLPETHIEELRGNLEKTDFTKIKERDLELSRLVMKVDSDIQQSKERLIQLQNDQEQKNDALKSIESLVKEQLPSSEELEASLKVAQKKVWEQEKLLRDEEKLSSVLAKTREQYLSLKNEIFKKTETINKNVQDLNSIIGPMGFIETITPKNIILLKSEVKKLTLFLDIESQGEKLIQEQNFLTANAKEAQSNFSQVCATLAEIEERITSLTETLNKELSGKKASELIFAFSHKVKESTEALTLKERDLKAQELKLKESQSRLYTLDELIKDIDLQFTKESHALRESSKVALPRLSPELETLTSKLSTLSLELKSPGSLFVPLQDLLESQKALFKEKTSELKMNFASVRARLEDWEKRQDRISLLILKAQDLTENLERRARLYEVLGKDELRTFVLSLVEENLIIQTNEELLKLCQGRYEIVHQSKRMKLTPEFYILDKYREGGLRKVSTLSGGETFMVSLAMALGLAEMTRGKAEIDTLFIDEGFGTLDQESLEDVLDMLKQIQTRGLMVGIISHVKALTNALPVNLQVTKKQDGTSNVSVVYN
jgi:exonuclease SbcC